MDAEGSYMDVFTRVPVIFMETPDCFDNQCVFSNFWIMLRATSCSPR